MNDNNSDILQFRAAPFWDVTIFYTKLAIPAYPDWVGSVREGIIAEHDSNFMISKFLGKYHRWQQRVMGPMSNNLHMSPSNSYRFIHQIIEEVTRNNHDQFDPTQRIQLCPYALHSKLLVKASTILYQIVQQDTICEQSLTKIKHWFDILTSAPCINLVLETDQHHILTYDGSVQTHTNHGDNSHPFFDPGMLYIHIAQVVFQKCLIPVYTHDSEHTRSMRREQNRTCNEDSCSNWSLLCSLSFDYLFINNASTLDGHYPLNYDQIPNLGQYQEPISKTPCVHENHIRMMVETSQRLDNILEENTFYILDMSENSNKFTQEQMFMRTEVSLTEDLAGWKSCEKERKSRRGMKYTLSDTYPTPRNPTRWDKDIFMLGDNSLFYCNRA